MTTITFEEASLGLKRAVASYGPGYVDPYSDRDPRRTEAMEAATTLEDVVNITLGEHSLGAKSRYRNDKERHCLVGWVLAHELGTDTELLDLADAVGLSIEQLLTHADMPYRADGRTTALLRAAQLYQDAGFSWAEACHHAHRLAAVVES